MFRFLAGLFRSQPDEPTLIVSGGSDGWRPDNRPTESSGGCVIPSRSEPPDRPDMMLIDMRPDSFGQNSEGYYVE